MTLLDIDLPKWTQMIVTGKSVTEDQAKEIIFRTDGFLTNPNGFSNNAEFKEHYHDMSGLNELTAGCLHSEKQLKSAINFIYTEYVNNDWASSAFIFGAHGWCNPNGEIMFIDNIGRYPIVQDVLNDWATLVTAFPYLDLNVSLIGDDSTPLVNIKVSEGKAILQDPNISVHNGISLKRNFNDIKDGRNGLGLPKQWYKDYAQMVRNKLVELHLIK